MKYGSGSPASLPVSAEPVPGEQPREGALLDAQPQEGGHHVGDRQLGLAGAGADHAPAVLERPVEALLAVEVVRDQLLVDPRPGGDRADPRAGETMLAELDHSGVEDALAGALGIALAVLAAGGPAGLGHEAHPNKVM